MNTAMIKRRTQLANNQIDLFCYYNYAEMFLNVARNDESLFTYMAPIFIRDLSVFLFETIKMYGFGYNFIIDNILNNEFYNDLKYIRNRIKLHKKGGNKEDINSIIFMMQDKYKTNKKDLLYIFRNDTSMFYQNGKRFVGSDFYTYYIFGKLTNKMINSAILKDFSFYITNSIKKLYDITICDENKKNLSQKFLKEKNEYYISIEFRDEKIDKIIKNSEFSKVITFESILIIQEISFIEILLCYILDIELITSELFLYFIVKQISIKFDEIFDSLFNIIKNMKEGKKLEKILLENNILPLNKETQEFARNLRNNIHYINYDWDIKEGLISIGDLFNNQAKVDNWGDSYLVQFDKMFKLISNLSQTLRKYVLCIKSN